MKPAGLARKVAVSNAHATVAVGARWRGMTRTERAGNSTLSLKKEGTGALQVSCIVHNRIAFEQPHHSSSRAVAPACQCWQSQVDAM